MTNFKARQHWGLVLMAGGVAVGTALQAHWLAAVISAAVAIVLLVAIRRQRD